MFSYTDEKYVFAYMKGTKFTKISHQDINLVPASDPLYMSPVHMEDIKIGFKSQNIKSIHGIPLVIKKEGIDEFSKKYLDTVFCSWCMTETYSKALGETSYQVILPLKFGFADRLTVGHIVHELYKKHPNVFLTTYPSINEKTCSFVDVPNYGSCNLVAENSDKRVILSNLIDSCGAAGVTAPYAVYSDIEKREREFYSNNFLVSGKSGNTISISYFDICNNYVNTFLDLVNNHGFTPKEADNHLSGGHLKFIKNDYLNYVLSVVAMGLNFGDLEYKDATLNQNELTGKEYEYNLKHNKWRARGDNKWNIAMMYPKCYGEWRALWFLDKAVQFELPDIFEPKYKQLKEYLTINQNNCEAISYLKEKYREI